MLINAQTKISSILKENAEALDAIISISPKFEKLRNPFLRKIMAARTSIATASKIGGCQVSDFFDKLKPLGFEIDDSILPAGNEKSKWPAFLQTMQKEQLTTLDVRPLLDSGKDPLGVIIEKVSSLKPGQVLKIVSSFYPEPLVLLLRKQDFDSFADRISDDLVETYFYRCNDAVSPVGQPEGAHGSECWDKVFAQHKGRLQEIDVRHLEMPMPMMAILDALDKLSADTALFVYHKRIPVYLLSELRERNFSYRIKEVGEGEVHLLIYKG